MAQKGVLRGEREGLEKKFYDLCFKIVTENGYKLYDLEWHPGSGELRLFIMDPKTGSAVIDDCAKIDRELSPFIENETWMPDNLVLEVSSPGLFRSLTSVEHFKMIEGQEALVTLFKNISEEQCPDLPRAFRHNMKPKVKVIEALEDSVKVELKNIVFNLPYEQIKKASLETDLNQAKEED